MADVVRRHVAHNIGENHITVDVDSPDDDGRGGIYNGDVNSPMLCRSAPRRLDRCRRSRGVGAVAALVSASLIASGCASQDNPSSVSGESAPATTQTDDDTVSSQPTSSEPAATAEQVVERLFESLAGSDPNAMVAEAVADERALELAIARQEGIEQELGGPEATAAAFAALDAEFASLAGELASPVAFGFRRQASAASGIGEGVVGGVLAGAMGAEAAVSASNDGTTGTRSGDGVTMTVAADKVIVDIDATRTAQGLTTRLKSHVEFNPCPDADGVLTLKAKVDVTTTTPEGRGQTAVLDVTVVAHLNDDAQVASTEDTFRMKRTGLTGGSFWDQTVGMAGGTTTVNTNDFNWFTGEISDRDETTRMAVVLGTLIKSFLLKAAAKGYESGRCIDLQVSASPGPSGLEPESTSSITASPRAKQDNQPAGGTVTAELTAGTEKVEPSGSKVDADATFTFTAPDDYDLTGTVKFESRSKRGVGKAELTLDTKQDCIVGTWTMDNASMTEILQAPAAAAGGSMVAVGGPVVTVFAKDGTLTHSLDGFQLITEVPEGTMTAKYRGTDRGEWVRRDDGSYAITTMQMGTSVSADVTVGGMSMSVPSNYTAMLNPDVAMTCEGDTITVTTAHGAVTLTRTE